MTNLNTNVKELAKKTADLTLENVSESLKKIDAIEKQIEALQEQRKQEREALIVLERKRDLAITFCEEIEEATQLELSLQETACVNVCLDLLGHDHSSFKVTENYKAQRQALKPLNDHLEQENKKMVAVELEKEEKQKAKAKKNKVTIAQLNALKKVLNAENRQDKKQKGVWEVNLNKGTVRALVKKGLVIRTRSTSMFGYDFIVSLTEAGKEIVS